MRLHVFLFEGVIRSRQKCEPPKGRNRKKRSQKEEFVCGKGKIASGCEHGRCSRAINSRQAPEINYLEGY